MNEITVSARNLDDAITEALIELSITSDQLEYDVIEKGSEGFLGIGRKQAVIKARKKYVAEPVDDFKFDNLGTDFSSVTEHFSSTSEEKEVKKEVKREVKKEVKPEEHKEAKKEFRKEPKKEFHKEIKEPYKENRKDNRNDLKKDIKKDFREFKKDEPKLSEVLPETKQACIEFLENVFKTMELEVELVTDTDAEGALAIELKGDNMGILIGKRGQTLDALQYLANRVANKYQEGFIRVKLDTENYRKRRQDTLENLAKNIASKVKRTRRPVSLEPMNPYERRIIHSALQGDRYVSTHSEGEEPYRRVVVAPTKR